MSKRKQPSLVIIGLVVAVLGAVAYFTSLVAYAIYISNMNDLRTVLNPASSPAFNFMIRGYMVAFVLAATGLLLPAVVAVLEARKAKSEESLRNKKLMNSALIISAAMLFATVSSGVLPFFNIGEAEANTPTPKVIRLLKDDVAVKFGTFDEKAKAVPVTVTNKRSSATDYIIIIDALDRGGHQLAQDSIYTMSMEGHGTQEYKIFYSSYTKASQEQLGSATFKINDITVVDRAPTK